jgi:hypothetical protein
MGWGDQILAVVNTAEGVRLWASTDGRDWEPLAASPVLSHSDQYDVRAVDAAAGPLGIAVTAELFPPRRPIPPVTLEKGDVAVTIDLDSSHFLVADTATGALLFETDLGDEDVVVIDEEAGNITILHPETGDEVTSFTFDEFEKARMKAFDEAGFEGPEDGESRATPVLFFSPDGERWSSVRTEEIVGSDHFPSGVIVGDDAVIVSWYDPSEYEDDSEEAPADIGDDLPGIVWVGRLVGVQSD